jgi:hypothetical protein
MQNWYSKLLYSAMMLCLGTQHAAGCAVPTRIEVTNATGQQVRRLSINDDSRAPLTASRVNILPADGLAPGARLAVNMPSCMGLYVAIAGLADGTERRYPGLDASRLRALELR